MRSFKDAKNNTWDINIATGEVKALRNTVGVDIVAKDGSGIIALSDPVNLCEALWCLCRKQAEARNITEEDFFAGFHGDSVVDATTALMDSITDFFPEARRVLLQRVKAISETADRAILEEAEKVITEMESKPVTDLVASLGLTRKS